MEVTKRMVDVAILSSLGLSTTEIARRIKTTPSAVSQIKRRIRDNISDKEFASMLLFSVGYKMCVKAVELQKELLDEIVEQYFVNDEVITHERGKFNKQEAQE